MFAKNYRAQLFLRNDSVFTVLVFMTNSLKIYIFRNKWDDEKSCIPDRVMDHAFAARASKHGGAIVDHWMES